MSKPLILATYNHQRKAMHPSEYMDFAKRTGIWDALHYLAAERMGKEANA